MKKYENLKNGQKTNVTATEKSVILQTDGESGNEEEETIDQECQNMSKLKILPDDDEKTVKEKYGENKQTIKNLL